MASSTPKVSKETIQMAGILVDVYGIAELSPGTTSVSALWLHHGRTQNKETMAEIGIQAVSTWNEHRSKHGFSRGVLALAIDQRNHGSRIVQEKGNKAWREGNKTHAIDMFSTVVGTVSDTQGLIDVVEGYLKVAVEGRMNVGWTIDQHLVLGISLGGHSAWQLMFRDERVTAGVEVIGCPDYIGEMQRRCKTEDTSD
jgi:hypothetical protein